ncbi:UNVERIFIED_CONTAM: hypothetical protein FKN15_033941 [Acipenser sinensis]
MAGLSVALRAPEPLLHDLSLDPLLGIPDAQATHSLSPSRDIMHLKAHMAVLELLAKRAGGPGTVAAPIAIPPLPQGSSGWMGCEASQLAKEVTLSIAATGEGASFSSDMQLDETLAEDEPGFEVASEASALPLSSLVSALMGCAAAFLQVPWMPAAEPRRSVLLILRSSRPS